ncbi:exosortase-associated protein EpsI, B-type [Crenobacter caeni]|uniref:EpsI family protein n=1 Tax=Crenobacter caeni TaxID=2705474 RepID=A0A6B2KSC0_9NEIS|nr:exosortase-associated protein EpsI, B-type [Crenobacter caeni]NDV13135.1 EpsI family protein [Crenobacter caeni]
MSGQTRRAFLASALMGGAALAAWAATPTRLLAAGRPAAALSAQLPQAFGAWRVDEGAARQVVNPQQQSELARIYADTLSRVYVNDEGQRIMLSLAYGRDQRDGMELHYPEVCYPAQGFREQAARDATLALPGRQMPVRELFMTLGGYRREPVTYWSLVGDEVVRGRRSKKMAEMAYGLSGVVPDGLLFRVSSIGPDDAASYALHHDFVHALYGALDESARDRFFGRAHG